MKTLSLFKIQTLVAIVLLTLINTPRATAQNTIAPESACTKCLNAAGANDAAKKACTLTCDLERGGTSTNECTQLYTDYQEAAKVYKKGMSQSKINSYQKCFSDDGSVGNSQDDSSDDLTEATDTKQCASFLKASACKRASGSISDLETASKDAKSLYKDAQEDFQKAQKDLKDSQKNAQRAMDSAQDKLRITERDYALQVAAIQNELIEKVTQEGQRMTAQVSALRKTVTGFKAAQAMVDKTVRDAEDAVEKSITSVEAQCRTEAQSLRDKKKDELKAKDEKDKAAGLKYNYSGTTLAGSTNRRKEKTQKEIQTVYVSTYKDCLEGTTGVGAAAKKATADALIDLASKKKEAADQHKNYEDQIQDAMNDFVDQTKMSAENKEMLKKATDLKLAAAKNAHDTTIEMTNKALAYAQQDAIDDREYLTNAISIAGAYQQTAQGNDTTAQLKLGCANNNSGYMDSDSYDKLEDFGENIENLEQAKNICSSYEASCKDTSSSAYRGFQSSCPTANKYNTGGDTNSSFRYRTKSSDPRGKPASSNSSN